MVEGFAFDSAATPLQVTGIDHIDFFLNDRDQGGVNIGRATPGTSSVAPWLARPWAMQASVSSLRSQRGPAARRSLPMPTRS